MGLRDLFRGTSNQESDNTKQNETEANKQLENQTQDTDTNDQQQDSNATESSSSSVTSTLTAKQNLAEIAGKYNIQRETLQDLLFDQQKEIQTDIDQLNQQIADAKKAADDSGTQITNIQNQMEEASQEASAPFVERQTELNSRIKENQDKAGALIDQVKDINAELSGLNTKQQELIQAETEISSKFESEKDPAMIVTLADQYRDDIKSNKAERDANEATIQAVDKKQRDLKAQLQAVRDKLTADQKELNDTNNQLEEVQQKVAADDEELSKQLDSLTQQMTQNQARLSELQDNLATKQSEIDAVNSDINKWLGVPVPVKGLVLDSDSEIILDMDGLSADQYEQMKLVVKVLTKRGIEHVGLYTSQFELNLTNQIATWTSELQVKGGVVSVYNPLYSLQHQGKLGAKYQLPDNAVKDEWNDDHTERTLELENGWTLKVRYYPSSDNIQTIDSYKDGHLSESSILTTEGQLTSNRFYNDDNTKNRDEYYSQSGLGVLNVHYEDDEISQVELLNAVGMQVQAFDSIEGFTAWWMKNNFNKAGLLVGAIENDQYRQSVSQTQGNVIALVTSSVADRDEFTSWASALPQQQYLVDNYETEMKLIKKLNQPLNISLLDPHNLPVTLGIPFTDAE
ncbi:hypothetical protein HC026_03380 [Lactobacillus sp. LC28-10]|uniref:Chromosome partition protein Smc n=1 Tax=Secundilactobacillus angelensis TaxID=2722706 RepID=A0ABX1KXJ6_9LACO|nr:hypothetical protein [Secundilactobacillus angelensis]MCH5461666.1 hypothetical protein [Secundilactobacillus angelensis]NLR17962.1 hypothetical protein [Secundilactobacillus angelensis]